MKKIILALTVLASAILASTTCASAEDNAAYTAYYDFIQDKLDAGGYDDLVYTPRTDSIIFAKLLDFNLDGTYELVTITNDQDLSHPGTYDTKLRVFTYWNGQMCEVFNDFPLYKDAFGFQIDGNGKPHIVYVNNNYDEPIYEFGTILYGEWQSIQIHKSFLYTWSYGGYVNGQHYSAHSDTGNFAWFINENYTPVSQRNRTNIYFGKSNPVSEYEFNSFLEFKRRWYDEMYTRNPDCRTSEDPFFTGFPSYTPYAVLEELAPYLPDHAAHFRTPSSWAEESVNRAISDGYVEAALQKKYSVPITRAEFCSLAAQFYEKKRNIPIEGRKTFADTSDENAEKMAYLGVVNGVDENNFVPDAYLTREMAAVILTNLAAAMEIPVEPAEPAFADNDSISWWALSGAGTAQSKGIMGGIGDNIFSPQGYYTREQSILTVARLENLFVPVERIELPASMEIQHLSKTAVPDFTIYPSNATNREVTWASNDQDILTVQDGLLAANAIGHSTLSLTAQNGVKASCTVDVVPKIKGIDKYIGKELNFLENYVLDNMFSEYKTKQIDSYDEIPYNTHVAGKLEVTGISEEPKLIRISTKLTKADSLITENNFNPYIKWRFVNDSGRQVKSGVELADLKKIGDTDSITIDISVLDEGQSYTLELANDLENEESPDERSPVVKVKGLPLKIRNGSSYLNIEKAEVSLEYRYDKFYPTITISGTANADEDELYDLRFKWFFADKKGNKAAVGTYSDCYLSGREVNSDGTFTKVIDIFLSDLAEGETYTLNFMNEDDYYDYDSDYDD